jgi:hypothetical protein
MPNIRMIKLEDEVGEQEEYNKVLFGKPGRSRHK